MISDISSNLALRYAPLLHFDQRETIPLIAVGCTVLTQTDRSPSFNRVLKVPTGGFVVEYAYYWDYDIQHMYDLEHIWVYVSANGQLLHAEASFHGKYLTLLAPELPGCLPPEDGHVHAFCQPGKHAFLPNGQLFRLLPDWFTCCNEQCGGGVLVGGPFQGVYTPTNEENERCARYIREKLAFQPTLRFSGTLAAEVPYLTWEELKRRIPERIAAECARLAKLE